MSVSSSWVGHLDADGRDDHAVGPAPGDRTDRDPEALGALHAPPDPDRADVERRDREVRQADQLVGRPQRIEDRRQAEVEDVVEGQDIHAHGNNATKDGVLANSPAWAASLQWDRSTRCP
jgi:hypothetical protein